MNAHCKTAAKVVVGAAVALYLLAGSHYEPGAERTAPPVAPVVAAAAEPELSEREKTIREEAGNIHVGCQAWYAVTGKGYCTYREALETAREIHRFDR